MEPTFLGEPVSSWESNTNFRTLRTLVWVTTATVVNDCAERALGVLTVFNTGRTRHRDKLFSRWFGTCVGSRRLLQPVQRDVLRPQLHLPNAAIFYEICTYSFFNYNCIVTLKLYDIFSNLLLILMKQHWQNISIMIIILIQ